MIAQPLDGELHEGPALTSALMLGVRSDHLHHHEWLVQVLHQDHKPHEVVVGRGYHEGFRAGGQAGGPYASPAFLT